MNDEQILKAGGWEQTGWRWQTADRRGKVTYWRKDGHEFPQHFALYLQRNRASIPWLCGESASGKLDNAALEALDSR